MNLSDKPSAPQDQLLARLGGGYVLRVHTSSQLISSLIGPLIGLYYVYITAGLTGPQFILLIASTLVAILLVNGLHAVYAGRITRQARLYLDHIYKGRPLPLESDGKAAWDEIIALPRQSAIAQLIQVYLLIVLPVTLFMRWEGQANWTQVVIIIVSGSLAGMAVLIQSILYLDNQLAPARRVLLPGDVSSQTVRLGVGQRTRQYFVTSVLLFSAILTIGLLGYLKILSIASNAADPGLILGQYQTQVIIIGMVVFILGIFLASHLVRSVFLPVQEMSRVMEAFKKGDLSERARIITSDETASLTIHLNQLLDQLQASQTSMEQQVRERTAALENTNDQLRAITQITSEAASIQDLNALLNRIAHRIADRFGYYHAAIFLLDETGRYAVLQSASSDGGRHMLSSGLRLEVGQQNIVGAAIFQNHPRIALNAGKDAAFFDNPELPLAQSELAIPLIARNKIIGALDLQSSQPSGFNQENIALLQSLADQVALVIQNTRLIAETQEALHKLEAATAEDVRRAWREQAQEQKRAYHYTSGGLTPLMQSGSPEPATEISAGVTGSLDLSSALKGGRAATSHLEIPISLRGQQIGTIILQRKGDTPWAEAEKSLAEDVASQVGLALENARLLENTERRAAQEQSLIDLTARLSRSLDPDTLLQATVRELHQLPNVSEVSVYITPPKSPADGPARSS